MRFLSSHVSLAKRARQAAGPGRVMAPVMEGNLNFSAIFHALEASNCKYMLVEQDDCYGESPFDCLKTSYENLANAGYR